MKGSVYQSVIFMLQCSQTAHSPFLDYGQYLKLDLESFDFRNLPFLLQRSQFQELKRVLQSHARISQQQLHAIFVAICDVNHPEASALLEYLFRTGKIDPTFDDCRPLRTFCSHGNTELVRELLENPFVNPAVHSNFCIRVACRNQHRDVVKMLLNDPRVDPSAENNEVFHFACLSGKTEVAHALLQASRLIPSSGSLHMACWNGYTEIVKLLLWHPLVDPGKGDNEAIIAASSKGNLEIVRLLLMDSRVDPSARHSVAFRVACQDGHHEVVKLLLEDIRIDPTVDENEAFVAAAASGSLETVSVLLADPRIDPACNGNRALELASSHGHFTIVRLLCQYPRVHVRNTAALSLAVREEYADIVQLLLKYYGKFLLEEEMHQCQSAFAIACCNDSTIIVEQLLELGVDPSFEENYPLILACEHDSFHVARRLLLLDSVQRSLDIDLCATTAAKFCAIDVLSLFVEHPQLNFGFRDGTLLRIAIANQSRQLVESFLKHPKAEMDKYGQSCFELACKFQSQEILKLLLSSEYVNVEANNSRGVRFAVRRSNWAALEHLLSNHHIKQSIAGTDLFHCAVRHSLFEIASELWVYAETGRSGAGAIDYLSQKEVRNHFLSELARVRSTISTGEDENGTRESDCESGDGSDIYSMKFKAFMASHGFDSPFEYDSDSDDPFPAEEDFDE
jgi:ankyrin repeat protein